MADIKGCLDEWVNEIVEHIIKASSINDPASISSGSRGRKTAKTQSKDIQQYKLPEDQFEAAFSDLQKILLKKVIQSVGEALFDAIKEVGEDIAFKYVRLIAILVCPDIDRHPAVIKYCLLPLIKDPLIDSLSNQIKAGLDSWISHCYSECVK